MQQVIEKAGTLDREKVKKVLEKDKFKCLLYPTVRYVSERGYTNINKFAFTGVLQWQNGELLTVHPKSIADADFMYPVPWRK